MHDLDGGAGAAVARLHDEQARLHQLVDEPLHLAALARQLGELVEPDDGARALGRDQAQEQRARERRAPAASARRAPRRRALASAPAMPPSAL